MSQTSLSLNLQQIPSDVRLKDESKKVKVDYLVFFTFLSFCTLWWVLSHTFFLRGANALTTTAVPLTASAVQSYTGRICCNKPAPCSGYVVAFRADHIRSWQFLWFVRFPKCPVLMEVTLTTTKQMQSDRKSDAGMEQKKTKTCADSALQMTSQYRQKLIILCCSELLMWLNLSANE